ncbi:MAG: hypothetical protein WD872_11740 [Pirellulaceae bacterium]
MADKDRTDKNEIRFEDLVPVGSRVSWGAILAGAVVALAVCFVLTLLGTAIGFSVSDNVDGESLGYGAAIWAVVATVFALFVGGWVTSQCCVGENQKEAAVHGIIMWGTVMAMLLWMVASGISSGFNAMLEVANVAGQAAENTSTDTWQTMARNAGISQTQIDQMQENTATATADARQAATDPANQEAAQEVATQATWWTLGGTALSMVAAIGGALMGAGPTFRVLTTSVWQRPALAGGR